MRIFAEEASRRAFSTKQPSRWLQRRPRHASASEHTLDQVSSAG